MSGYSDFTDMLGAIGGTLGAGIGIFSSPTPPDDESVCLLDGLPLPGVVQYTQVSQRKDFEKVPIDGLSGSVKLYHGQLDADVRMNLILTTDDPPPGLVDDIGTALSGDIGGLIGDITDGGKTPSKTATEKLEMIQAFFVQYDDFEFGKGAKVPRAFVISQKKVNARGVTKVFFEGFDDSQSSNSDTISVDLTFLEYQPATVKFETGEAAPPPPPETPEPDTTSPF